MKFWRFTERMCVFQLEIFVELWKLHYFSFIVWNKHKLHDLDICFGLNIFWTSQFFLWTSHLGWIPRLKCTLSYRDLMVYNPPPQSKDDFLRKLHNVIARWTSVTAASHHSPSIHSQYWKHRLEKQMAGLTPQGLQSSSCQRMEVRDSSRL